MAHIEIKATNDPRSNSSSPNGSTLELEFPSSAPQLGNYKIMDLPFSVSDVSKLKRRQVTATTVSRKDLDARWDETSCLLTMTFR
jgi:hypothetical protein